MSKICIRAAKISDYHDIFMLNQDLGYYYPEEKVKDRIAYITENTKDVIFVAELAGEVVGYIHGSPYENLYNDPQVNIMAFVVKERYRKSGIGSDLINTLETWAKENGFNGMRLVSGFDRLDAHRFYQNHGYIFRKNQKNFIKSFNID
ncbi:MAG: GNAT family N-acetyltransferase [Eubacteriales bacterium]